MPVNREFPKDHTTLTEDHWRQWVLFHHRKRTELTNERKFIAWVRLSLAVVTLGFIVKRLELFLMSRGGVGWQESIPNAALWIPPFFYITGAIIMIFATLEFFRDRRRIRTGDTNTSVLLDTLIVLLLLAIVSVAVLLSVPNQ